MKTPVKFAIAAVLALPMVALGGMVAAGITPLALGMHDTVHTDTAGVAFGGYDVVASHADQHVLGDLQHSADHAGATWQFSTPENLATFQADPARYAPACGGYCAFAATKGFAAPGEPETSTVHAGTLYVFADSDVQAMAMADPAALEQSCASFD